jgi:hypothetical protein
MEDVAERQIRIEQRRSQIPKAYRGIYDKAVRGRSLRAAVKAQCLECCCWQRKEVELCTDLGCPLYAVRPYQGFSERTPKKVRPAQGFSQDGHDGGFNGAESTK